MFSELGRGTEFLVAITVGLMVIGPKDLPLVLRKLGQMVAKVRGMAGEFRAAFDEMARQSELDELRKEVQAMRDAQLADFATLHGDVTTLVAPFQEPTGDLQEGAPPPIEGTQQVAAEQPHPPTEPVAKAKRTPRSPKAAPLAKTQAELDPQAVGPANEQASPPQRPGNSNDG
jgi:sec-independent protein translocase protein TatB